MLKKCAQLFVPTESCGLAGCSVYLLLTEFEGRTVSHGPSFFFLDLWPKREGSITYGTDRENMVSKIFIISLLCV